MAYSKAQQKATAKYMAANYGRIEFAIHKELKERIKAAAEQAGESTTEYIRKAVLTRMEAEQQNAEQPNS